MKIDTFVYFVTFASKTVEARCEVTYKHEIKGIEDIQLIEEQIELQENKQGVFVTNYILMDSYNANERKKSEETN